MAFKKVEKTDFAIFEVEGEQLTGVLEAGGTINTKHGAADYVLINGKKLIVSAALTPLIENDLFGKLVRITYEGEKKNPRTRQLYKSFTIEVDDEVEAEAPTPKRK